MNPRHVASLLGLVLYVLAGAELVPIAWCLYPLDAVSLRAFLAGASTCAGLGLLLRAIGRREGELYRRDGVLIVVASWLLASLAGAIPYLASGAIPTFADALFESASGFTTTGASILVEIEAQPRAILFWRSLTQWLGGIGIVVLFVALLSELGPGARFLFKLEVPGPKAEILHARVRQTAGALFRVYLALTLLQTGLMMLFGADVYDALTHAFATLSTGGFSPYADSIAHFSPLLQTVVLVFMLAAGTNFALLYAFARARDPGVFRDIEFRFYLWLVTLATLLVTLVVALQSNDATDVATTTLAAAFQVASLATTTGFSTADYTSWPGLAQTALVGLMFFGGCAGSTSGGAKLIRLLIGVKLALREIRLTFSPNSVIAVAVGHQIVPEASARAVAALLLLWGLGWGVGTMLLAVGEIDVLTAATASLATLSNIGPGLAGVGPNENFAFFADWQKLVMVLLMWLGRLEFFAVLAVLLPRFWRV